ncbi:SDR family NAD(P)-dependent oxidoreductase [Actinomycetospora atypica]|uniref:SDR family NAD(P)-dependent oxidoreductase n=1 Tax=Actinomycetospora atypica TaxID=1290095 RepID=A0ABV9YJ32_9PSEU
MTGTDPLAPFRLDGRVAVVTGASSGLGAHFALALAAAGAHVVLAARRREHLDAVAAAVGRRCLVVVTDVTEPEQCSALVDAALAEFGRLDVLVNNAGSGYAARAEHDDPARAAALLQLNVLGALQMAGAAGRPMLGAGRGSIVNVSSALGLVPRGLPQAAYSASKSALLGLTRDLAQQWSGRGVRVNALAPGFFASEMTAPLLASGSGTARVLENTPMGRIGRLDELTGPLLLLASDAGSYITGTTLCVDGGWAMH